MATAFAGLAAQFADTAFHQVNVRQANKANTKREDQSRSTRAQAARKAVLDRSIPTTYAFFAFHPLNSRYSGIGAKDLFTWIVRISPQGGQGVAAEDHYAFSMDGHHPNNPPGSMFWQEGHPLDHTYYLQKVHGKEVMDVAGKIFRLVELHLDRAEDGFNYKIMELSAPFGAPFARQAWPTGYRRSRWLGIPEERYHHTPPGSSVGGSDAGSSVGGSYAGSSVGGSYAGSQPQAESVEDQPQSSRQGAQGRGRFAR